MGPPRKGTQTDLAHELQVVDQHQHRREPRPAARVEQVESQDEAQRDRAAEQPAVGAAKSEERSTHEVNSTGDRAVIGGMHQEGSIARHLAHGAEITSREDHLEHGTHCRSDPSASDMQSRGVRTQQAQEAEAAERKRHLWSIRVRTRRTGSRHTRCCTSRCCRRRSRGGRRGTPGSCPTRASSRAVRKRPQAQGTRISSTQSANQHSRISGTNGEGVMAMEARPVAQKRRAHLRRQLAFEAGTASGAGFAASSVGEVRFLLALTVAACGEKQQGRR